MLDGKDIIKTLIELLEAQEHIKVTYELKEDVDEQHKILSSSGKSLKAC